MKRTTLRAVVSLVAFITGNAWAQTQDTTVTYTYDNMGNVKSVNRPLGRSTSYSYDALNRLTQQNVTFGSGTLTITQGYDGQDKVLSVTDPRNLVTNYTVDGLGNTSQLSSPDTKVSGYTVDEAGNVLTMTDARGKTTRFQYDALGRLLQVQYQSGTPSQFEYDGGPGGPAVETGNLTRITDESGSTTFTHDLKGRVLSKVQVVSANGSSVQFTVQYAYSTTGTAIGKLETMTYPSGARVNYHYDANGRASSVTLNPSDGAGGTNMLNEVPLLANITYTPTGAVQSWQWGGSALPAYQRTYDLNGRLTSYPTDLLGTVRTVAYNAASLVTGYTHAGGPNPAQYDQSFSYDTADRLTSFTQGGATTTYMYDADGNRIQQSGPSGTYTYSTISNQLNSVTFPIPRSYTYDAVGNRTGDGIYTYIYSDRGRLAQVGGNVQLNMYYNALGQRVLKTGAAGSTDYVYDEDGHSVGEYGQGSVLGTETVYLGDLPVAVVTPQGYFYLVADQIATPLVLAQPNGTTVWDWRNRDAFGNNVPAASAVLQQYDLRFPGQVADKETGLFYNYFRDYDPQTGRYVESDSLGLSAGVNTYGYVNGNSISYYDPYGLWAWGDPIPQGAVDFSAGFGDTLSFGLTNWVRNQMGTNGAVDKCSGYYTAGEVAGVAVDMVIGGAAGWEAAGAKGAGKEFSHWIPNRMGGPRSKWNGNYVTTVEHALSDPYRYQFMRRAWKAENPMPNVAQQQWVRIPNVYKGAGAGAAYGGGGAALSAQCICHQ